MVVALERAEREAAGHLLGKFGQFMIHELVGEVVRLGRDADGDVVAARRLGERHEIGHGFTDTRPRFDNAVRARHQGIAHLERHRDLLVARLVRGIHAIDQAAGSIIPLELIATRHLEPRKLIGVDALGRSVGLEHVGAGGWQREDRAGVLTREEREDGSVGPGHIGMHVREPLHKARRQVRQRDEQNAPNAAEGVDVGVGTVGDGGASKEVGHETQLMGRQTGQGDTRERKRVDPDVAHVDAALDRLDERAVERRVVRDDGASAHKIRECGNGVHGRGRVGDVGVRDARELSDLRRDQTGRVDERVKTVHDLAPRKSGRRDLDKLVILDREPRGLGVENDDILFDQAEFPRFRTLGERRIGIDDELRRSGLYGILDQHRTPARLRPMRIRPSHTWGNVISSV